MLTIDPSFGIRPAVDKTISRIYRDTRFSKDKSLFKSTMWLTFKRPRKDWKDAPAYFLEISPDSYRYGMGYYSVSSDTMYKFREMIDKKPKESVLNSDEIKKGLRAEEPVVDSALNIFGGRIFKTAKNS